MDWSRNLLHYKLYMWIFPSRKIEIVSTMFMRASLSSKPLSLTLIAGPIRMLAVVEAKNSRRVLLAMASKAGVKLRLCLVVFQF
jgi:hypothetical protein